MLPLKVVCILGSLVHTPNKEIITPSLKVVAFGRIKKMKKKKTKNCHPKSQQTSHGDLKGQVRENHGNEVVKIVVAFDYKR